MGLDADTVLAEARRPEEAILDTARAKGADVIVVGSHGRTGLQKVLIGSVSERVIGTTEGPVLIVKAG
jgi:nucleotide-binding universal stress UspA family protein